MALVLLISGCKKKEGGPCRKDQVGCANPSTKLICESGKFKALPCKGADGCQEDATSVKCDISGDSDGDPCAGDGAVCQSGGKGIANCDDGEVKVASCRGPGGCKKVGSKLTCDHSIAAVGDACESGDSACTKDAIQMLECKGRKFELHSTCRGPKACGPMDGDATKIFCDASIGQVGDPCPGEGAACSVDKTHYLECVAGKLVDKMACRGPEGCAFKGDMAVCDASRGVIGDPCDGAGFACALDGKSELTCKDGKMATAKTCTCKTQDDGIVCN